MASHVIKGISTCYVVNTFASRPGLKTCKLISSIQQPSESWKVGLSDTIKYKCVCLSFKGVFRQWAVAAATSTCAVTLCPFGVHSSSDYSVAYWIASVAVWPSWMQEEHWAAGHRHVKEPQSCYRSNTVTLKEMQTNQTMQPCFLWSFCASLWSFCVSDDI